MRRAIARVMHERRSPQQDADVQPVGSRNETGYRLLGTGCIEQAGNVGAWRNDPARAAIDRPCAPDAKEAIADREA